MSAPDSSAWPPLSYSHLVWPELKELRKNAYCADLTRLTGSLTAGVLLSQIVFWFGPSPHGKTKLRVEKQGRLWLAKSREQWSQETGLSFKQIRSAQTRLVELGLIEVKLFRFKGLVNQHVVLNQDALLERLTALSAAQAPVSVVALPVPDEPDVEPTKL